MKTLAKVVVLLFIFLVLYFLKEGLSGDRETVSSMSDLGVLELVKNYSVNPISNPLRRTFFHFERHTDQYVKNWKKNIG